MYIWAATQQNLSSGFPTKLDLNQSPWLQTLVACSKFRYDTFQEANNKGADQIVWMRSLISAFVVRKPMKTGFLSSRPIYKLISSQSIIEIDSSFGSSSEASWFQKSELNFEKIKHG